MTILTNYFGLASAEFKVPTGAVAVPGRSTLKTSANAPEGVLLKSVDNMTQALDAGGLLMVSKVDPSKWMFLVGKHLELALRKNKLGVFSEIKQTTPVYKFTRIASLDGHKYNPPTHLDIYGGVLTPYLVDTPYFVGEGVDMIAIATSASEGLGYSHPGAYALSEGPTSGSLGPLMQTVITPISYMASEVPMNGTFATFMSGVQAHALSLVPDNLREYFRTTFSSAMSSFAFKETKPSITIPTFWESGFLSPLEIPSMFEIAGTGLYGEWGTTTAWNLINPPGSAFYADDAAMGVDVTTSAGRYLVDNRYGFKGDTSVSPHTFPYMTKGMKHLVKQTQTPLGAGMMEGLNVGLIRDGHTLGRTIISGTRYADQPSTSASLGSYLAGLVDGGMIADLRSKDYALNESTAESSVLTELQRLQPRENIFSGGTLTATIAAFSSAWDTAAKAAAQNDS